MIQCIRFPLVDRIHVGEKFGMTCLRLALLNPHDHKGSIRMFVNVAAEHIVTQLRQSQAGVCLWWNVNSSNDRMGGK